MNRKKLLVNFFLEEKPDLRILIAAEMCVFAPTNGDVGGRKFLLLEL